jgi:hypothetical protein
MAFALRASGVEVLAIFPELSRGTMLDFDLAPSFIEAGHIAARKALAAWDYSDSDTPESPPDDTEAHDESVGA